ncbi:Chemotaxis protein CheY [Aquisphaera giovannonii]|uniref:Chemotaxis protein CheY n=1 Tax=Aquisphaera giovannonii TaxID=406548 RepID=A0A5B9W6T5_9BACT|nr:response regulator [Aquisphaera giovannonii]QEH35690.1 Chemotaxis protein CheY [Aquisphaera giovannonii]
MLSSLCEPPEGRHRPLHILLADDNEMLRVAMRGLLQSLGHTVTPVRNGREAVDAASRLSFQVIILDVEMPELGGFEAASELRLRHDESPRPRILGISAEARDSEAYEKCGMDDFLVKPVRRSDFERALEPRRSPDGEGRGAGGGRVEFRHRGQS